MTEHETLRDFTQGCRDDFHEPDEQDIEFVGVVGTSLDNAFGTTISGTAVEHGYQEVVIVLRRGDRVERFNLATLIAAARR